MRLYFEDEAPRIGSGWRTVHVTLGWKWARLRCAASGRGTRLKREVFDPIMLKGERNPSITMLQLGRRR
jgi:hypothetical protein